MAMALPPAGALAAAAALDVSAAEWRMAAAGLGAAWAAASLSVFALDWAGAGSLRTLWRTFGATIAAHAAIFIALAAFAVRRGIAAAAFLLGSYALGLAVLLPLGYWLDGAVHEFRAHRG